MPQFSYPAALCYLPPPSHVTSASTMSVLMPPLRSAHGQCGNGIGSQCMVKVTGERSFSAVYRIQRAATVGSRWGVTAWAASVTRV